MIFFLNVKKDASLTAKIGKLRKKSFIGWTTGADAIKKFTPSLGIPYLGV